MTLPKPRYDLAGAAHDYPPREGAPTRTILLCTHGRSGSTLLGEALYFAGGLGCPLEYFHVGFRPGFEARWGTSGMAALRDRLWQHRTDPSSTLAVKLFWRDVSDIVADLAPGRFPALDQVPAAGIDAATYRAVADLLADLFPAPVHLHLRRDDVVRQAVSGLVATESGVWRAIPGVGGTAVERQVGYDVARIDAMIVNAAFCHAHWSAYFRANGVEPYALTYESLLSDHAATVEAVLRHLGSDQPAPPIRMQRQSDALTEAMVVRYVRETARARV